VKKQIANAKSKKVCVEVVAFVVMTQNNETHRAQRALVGFGYTWTACCRRARSTSVIHNRIFVNGARIVHQGNSSGDEGYSYRDEDGDDVAWCHDGLPRIHFLLMKFIIRRPFGYGSSRL